MSRIAAVLCRASNAVQASGCDDDLLLAALCMERGIDVTFVEALGRIETGSTDQVCLHGVQGPFVLLSRDSAEAVREHLARLDVRGRLLASDQALMPMIESKPQRSIFFIQPGGPADIPLLLQRIHRIRRDAAAKVTQIQIGPRNGALPIVSSLAIQPAPPRSDSPPSEPLPSVSASLRQHHREQDAGDEAKLEGLLDELDGFI